MHDVYLECNQYQLKISKKISTLKLDVVFTMSASNVASQSIWWPTLCFKQTKINNDTHDPHWNLNYRAIFELISWPNTYGSTLIWGGQRITKTTPWTTKYRGCVFFQCAYHFTVWYWPNMNRSINRTCSNITVIGTNTGSAPIRCNSICIWSESATNFNFPILPTAYQFTGLILKKNRGTSTIMGGDPLPACTRNGRLKVRFCSIFNTYGRGKFCILAVLNLSSIFS